jgi:ribosomal protein L11 methyltransferase
MPTRYILISLAIPEEQKDVATAVLSTYPLTGIEEGFDQCTVTFEQNDWQDDYRDSILDELKGAGVEATLVNVGTEEDQNWNAEWEASIDPVIVNDRIVIVPEWKADEMEAPFKLIITPKMSFGTGHHATTRMMCQLTERYVKEGEYWIDAGTGTGVLAILAVKLGARGAFAFDNNEWSIVNSQENIDRNGVADKVELLQAELGKITLPKCDGLAANLYRHLVLDHAEEFVGVVRSGGPILISGILKYDADEIINKFTMLDCTLEDQLAESEWVGLAFRTP